jgi:hypothetical protein
VTLEPHMLCTECQSDNRRELKMETMIHHANFRCGKADVCIYPTAWICLDCGFSTFIVPPIELQALREGDMEAGSESIAKRA